MPMEASSFSSQASYLEAVSSAIVAMPPDALRQSLEYVLPPVVRVLRAETEALGREKGDGVISSPAWPRERTRSRVRAAGLRPPPRTALTFLVAASKYRQKASPPMPVLVGSHTFRHAVTATAASAAEPPFRRISSPAAVASDCEHATMPLVPSAHVRRLLKSIVVAEARHASAVGGASEPPIAADRTPRAAGCDTTVDVSELPGTVSETTPGFPSRTRVEC